MERLSNDLGHDWKTPKQSFMKTEMQKNVVMIDRFLFLNGRFEIGAKDAKENHTFNSKTNDVLWSGLGATSCSPRFFFSGALAIH